MASYQEITHIKNKHNARTDQQETMLLRLFLPQQGALVPRYKSSYKIRTGLLTYRRRRRSRTKRLVSLIPLRSAILLLDRLRVVILLGKQNGAKQVDLLIRKEQKKLVMHRNPLQRTFDLAPSRHLVRTLPTDTK